MLRVCRNLALLALAVAAATPALADTTFTTRQGALNQAGQPVSATAQFTIHPDAVVVRVTNTVGELTSVHQALAGFSFSVMPRKAKGDLGYSAARTRSINGREVVTSSSSEDTKWILTRDNDVYTLRSPGLQRMILPLADAKGYPKADKSITEAPAANPFLVGTCTFQILIPELELTDDIVNVKFIWADEISAADKLTDTPADHSGGGGGGGLIESVPYTPPFYVYTPVGGSGEVPHGVGSGGDIEANGIGVANPPAAESLPPVVPPEVPPVTSSDTPPETGLIIPPEHKPNRPVPPTEPIVQPAVPEPASLGLLALGSLGLLARRRR